MKYILAGLLHDIGKFYQRTGIKLEKYYDIYKKNNSYTHACYTAQFIEENIKIKFESISSLMDESAGHHNSAYGIVKQADFISSGHDRKEAKMTDYADVSDDINENYKTRRLFTIFNELKIYEQKNKLKLLNLDPLLNQTYKDFGKNHLSNKEAEKEYLDLYEKFLTDVKKIDFNNINNYIKLHHLIYPIIKNYTTSIPANTISDMPTVSLYEHLKLTAAIAGCIEQETEEIPLVIFDYDVSGIQSFIYKITEGGSKKEKISKNLRTRSFYLSLLADFIAYYIIHKFNLSYENILYSSAGRGRLLLPNIKNFDEMILKICNEIESQLYKIHNGSLGIVFSYLKLDGNEFSKKPLDDFDNKKIRVNSKNQKFKEVISKENFSFIKSPLNKICTMCENNESKADICEFCNSMLELNDFILAKNDKFYIEFNYNDKVTNSDFTLKIGDIGEINFYLKYDFPINDDSFYLSINSYEVGEIKTYAMSLNKNISFTDISKYRKNSNFGDNKIAVIKMDVDNLGYIFKYGLKGERENKEKNQNNDKETSSKTLNLSRTLDLFFSYKLPKICGEKTYINYSGGDDLVIIVPACSALEIVERIINEFNIYTSYNKSLTISAGIDIFEAVSPVRYAIERAEKMLEKSKDVINKNSFSVLNVSISNDFLKEINEEITCYEKGIINNELSRGVIYDIYSALIMSLENEEKYRERYMRFIPHIAYSIKRNINNDEWTKKLKETFVFLDIDITTIKKYKVILGFVLMNTREEK